MNNLDLKSELTIMKNNIQVNFMEKEGEKALIELTKILLQVHYKKKYNNILKTEIKSKYNNYEYLKISIKYRFNETIIYTYIYEFSGTDLKSIVDFQVV